MPADNRPYIRVHNSMPEHPKVVGLSHGAFRTLIKLWCYCDRNATDGTVPAGVASDHRRSHLLELEKAGLLEYRGGDWHCHDYLDHQRSAADVAVTLSKARRAGSLAAHVRWHERRGKRMVDCSYCYPT